MIEPTIDYNLAVKRWEKAYSKEMDDAEKNMFIQGYVSAVNDCVKVFKMGKKEGGE